MKNHQTGREHTPTAPATLGTVTGIYPKELAVWRPEGGVRCALPKSLAAGREAVGVGDLVELESPAPGEYRLLRVRPRTSALYRGNRRAPGAPILIAANAQLMLAVATARSLPRRAGYLEGAILAARRAGMGAALYISKADGLDETAGRGLAGYLAPYGAIADHVFVGGPDPAPEALLQAVDGKTTVLVGERGCGKTTLVRALLRRLTGAEPGGGPAASTSSAVLFPAGPGTALIDTPGFRDFALEKIREEEIQTLFPELRAAAAGCAFRDCSHTHEADCGVQEAVMAGRVHPERLRAYRSLTGAAVPPRERTGRADPRGGTFTCRVCGALVTPEEAGTRHRNHCPHCLSSVHADNTPGDRAALCGGVMEPIGVWVRRDGEWAIIHRCRTCGALHSNRIAADDNPLLLMSIAVKPLSRPPFPLHRLEPSV